jgi:hypothetical protein
MKIVHALLIVGMSLTAGTALAQPAPIPPPEIEAGPPPPAPVGPNWALVPGHWHWNGYRYVWVHRHWALREPGWHAGAVYVPGHWYQGPAGGWHWMPAHWAP